MSWAFWLALPFVILAATFAVGVLALLGFVVFALREDAKEERAWKARHAEIERNLAEARENIKSVYDQDAKAK